LCHNQNQVQRTLPNEVRRTEFGVLAPEWRPSEFTSGQGWAAAQAGGRGAAARRASSVVFRRRTSRYVGGGCLRHRSYLPAIAGAGRRPAYHARRRIDGNQGGDFGHDLGSIGVVPGGVFRLLRLASGGEQALRQGGDDLPVGPGKAEGAMAAFTIWMRRSLLVKVPVFSAKLTPGSRTSA